MKYFININQWVLSKTNLDLIDASILEYLRDICSSEDKNIVANRQDGYTWVSMMSLMKQMPMIKIGTRTGLKNRLDKLEDGGWIKRVYSKESKMLIKLTSKVDTLKSSVPYIQKQEKGGLRGL
jgi:hypothetical protein